MSNEEQQLPEAGVYYCPECLIEYDVYDPRDLQCDECGGPLSPGPLQWEVVSREDLKDGDGGDEEEIEGYRPLPLL